MINGRLRKLVFFLILLFFIIGVSVLLYFLLLPKKTDKKTDKNSNNQYILQHNWSGKDLHPENGKFRYFTDADPTRGSVLYGEFSDLLSIRTNDALQINIGAIVENDIGEEDLPRRQSIRLESISEFDSGLFVFDISRMPAGVGVWAALWLLGAPGTGDTWASNGEIDIMESVNSDSRYPWSKNNKFNTTTLHTNSSENMAQCLQNNVDGITNPNCEATGNSSDSACGYNANQACPYEGCSVISDDETSAGYKFNDNNGGVYACELTKEGRITYWFWSRNDETMPSDFNTNPDTWSVKTGTNNKIVFDKCPEQFKRQYIIINTTLCGTWAGGKYGDNGLEGCQNAVVNPDYPLEEEYWLINSIKIFQKQ